MNKAENQCRQYKNLTWNPGMLKNPGTKGWKKNASGIWKKEPLGSARFKDNPVNIQKKNVMRDRRRKSNVTGDQWIKRRMSDFKGKSRVKFKRENSSRLDAIVKMGNKLDHIENLNSELEQKLTELPGRRGKQLDHIVNLNTAID